MLLASILAACLAVGGIDPSLDDSLGAVLVFKTGKTLEVRAWKLDGRVVRLTSLKGEPQVVRASLIHLPASEQRTAAHKNRGRRDLSQEAAAGAKVRDHRKRVRDANDLHRARSSGKRAITQGTGPGAQIVAVDDGAEPTPPPRPEAERTLLFFTSAGCDDCRRVANDVLIDPAVSRLLAAYDLKEVDVDIDPDIGREHRVGELPAFVILGKSGKPLKRRAGFLSASALAQWLER